MHDIILSYTAFSGSQPGCEPGPAAAQEGLNTLTFTRHVSVMSITLSTVPLDPTRPGYQAPLPLDQVKPLLPPSRSHPGAGLVPRCVPPRAAVWCCRRARGLVCAVPVMQSLSGKRS